MYKRQVLDNLYALSDSPVLLSELLDLLRYRYEQIDFIDEPVDLGFDCPLDLHCTYTRDQLLVALDLSLIHISGQGNFRIQALLYLFPRQHVHFQTGVPGWHLRSFLCYGLLRNREPVR